MLNKGNYLLCGSLLFLAIVVAYVMYTVDFRHEIGVLNKYQDMRAPYTKHQEMRTDHPENKEMRANRHESQDETHAHHHDHGCYTINDIFDNTQHPKALLQKRGCTQRFPDALIIGSRKCGTTTLRNFMSVHPQIATADEEIGFYSSKFYMGVNWYLRQMPYALPNQSVVEKTPRYFVYPDVPSYVRQDLGPDIKLILVLRDPVIRAVSDFTHLYISRHGRSPRAVHGDSMKSLTPRQDKLKKKFNERKKYYHRIHPNYTIGETFEESILTRDGELELNSAIIDTGIYIKYLKKWLQNYSLNQILVLDGEILITKPYEILSKVEKFLGIQQYFTPKHFFFNQQKGFFCLTKPIYACMPKSKGRSHPTVSNTTLEKLKEFYRPYNLKLEELLNQTVSWA